VEGYKKGIEYFQQAIAKDPTYALAYSGLADSYAVFAGFGSVSPKEGYPKAKEAAQKALEIDDTLAEAHASLAVIKTLYDWDWSGGEREIQRAIELNPNYATAHQWYALTLGATGRLEEAIAESKRALRLDPISMIANWNAGYIFYLARQYDQAIEQERKTLELNPSFVPTYGVLGESYMQKSMYKEALAEFEKALAISPDSADALRGLGEAYVLGGRKAEAQKVLDRLNELSKHKYVAAWTYAAVCVALGQQDKAYQWLEKAYEERSISLAPSIKGDPMWDPLRSDPRWADLLRRMNLQP
jgi:tetratricopeptide (TPR) repeat protein